MIVWHLCARLGPAVLTVFTLLLVACTGLGADPADSSTPPPAATAAAPSAMPSVTATVMGFSGSPTSRPPLWGEIWLQPLPGSSTEGIARIEADTRTGPARVTIEARVPHDQSSTVHLHGGACSRPGASTGEMGMLHGDSQGRADLRTESAVISGSGAALPLTMELLADGDHLIELHDSQGRRLACGDIPTIGQE